MRARQLSWLFATVVLALYGVSDEMQGRQATQSRVTVLRSTTQLVQVTVVATGPKGAMVTDLARDDFRLSEQGTLRQISIFTKNWVTEDTPTATSAANFGRFSNRVQQKGRGSLNILLLDELDTGRGDWERDWPEVLRFIERLSPSDRIAIYSLDGVNGLRVLQDYDDDPRGLLTRLQKLPHPTLVALLPPMAPYEDSAAASFSKRDAHREMPELLSLGRLQGLTNALNAIADHMAGRSGRKSLIWLSGVFPDPFPPLHPVSATGEAYHSRMLEAINHLLANDVGIYPVDARGLMPDHTFDAESENIPIGPVSPGASNSLHLYDFSAPMDLARRSGGKAYFNTNGVAQSLRDAAFSERSSYTLGFYLSGEPDGRYHSIKLTVDRPEIQLRYRPGYWAFPTVQEGAGTAQGQLRAALESPFMTSSIEVEADTRAEPGQSGKCVVAIYINPRNLALRSDGETQHARLDILIGQKDGAGRIFAIPPYSVPLSVPDSLLNSRGWLTTQVALALRGPTRYMRIVVRDQTSGRIGSVDIPITR